MSEESDKFGEAVQHLEQKIRRDVVAGFRSADDILEAAVECAGYKLSNPDVLTPIARTLLRDSLAEHHSAQAGWPGQTDCDRLEEAFADLESQGIVCRQNFSCCGNCGCAEIGEEIGATEEAGQTVVGYAFYHMQDTQSAVDGNGLCLNYGSVEDGEQAVVAVAREIVAALESHGLRTEWSGNWQQRIKVQLDWKRRRPIEIGWDVDDA